MAFFAFAAFLDECQERALLTLSLFPKIHTKSVHAKKEPAEVQKIDLLSSTTIVTEFRYTTLEFNSDPELN